MTTQQGTISSAIRQNIRQLEVFSDLSDEEMDILVRHFKIRSLDEDEILFRQGDVGDFFAVIIEGRLEITRHTKKDTPVALASLASGATLGAMALIDQETRSASAIAVEPSTIFLIPKKSFDTLIENHPQCGVKLLRKIAKTLCDKIRETSNMFAEYAELGIQP